MVNPKKIFLYHKKKFEILVSACNRSLVIPILVGIMMMMMMMIMMMPSVN